MGQSPPSEDKPDSGDMPMVRKNRGFVYFKSDFNTFDLENGESELCNQWNGENRPLVTDKPVGFQKYRLKFKKENYRSF